MIDSPLATGVEVVTVPAARLEFRPPPFGCAGGVSSVVPWTFTMHGGVAGVPVAAQVPGSITPLIETFSELSARKSAVPTGTGKVVMS